MCDFLDDLDTAKEESPNTVYIEFLQNYKKYSNVCYGFVEGKDDPCFYRGMVEHSIPSTWKVDLYKAGNKQKVLSLYTVFDWDRFDKRQILFFIDRDLSTILDETLPDETNIYITDGYSIENNVVDINTCDRILCEIYGFHNENKDEIAKILDCFNEQLLDFKISLIPIMSNIIHWKKEGIKANYQNFKLKDTHKIEKGKLHLKHDRTKILEILYTQSGVDLECCQEDCILQIEKLYTENNDYQDVTRGKFVLWFLVEFCESVYKEYADLDFASISKPQKKGVNLSEANAILQAAPRCRIPSSLLSFLKNTIIPFIQEKEIS